MIGGEGDQMTNGPTGASGGEPASPGPEPVRPVIVSEPISPGEIPASRIVGPTTVDIVEERPLSRRFFLQEVVRASLAIIFSGILAITVYLSFRQTASDSWANTKELLELLLPAETALLGTAVGFYFGSEKAGPSTPPA